MGNIKAIETVYHGYRFRSRLEARWAVFFDTLGIKWAYEAEGYDLGDAGWYLPDFWIDSGTDDGFWIEVKAHKNLSERELSVANKLSEFAPGYVAFGQPGIPEYRGGYLPFSGTWNVEDYQGDGWHLFFGKYNSMPIDTSARSLLQKENMRRFCCWHEYMLDGNGTGEYKLWPVPSFEIANVQNPRETFDSLRTHYAITQDDLVEANPLISGRKSIDSEGLRSAYTAARSARFEHNEREAIF